LEKLLAGVRPAVVGLENIFDTMCHLSVLSEYYKKIFLTTTYHE